ncbi:MAG: TonB-dependent receptor plug domain-containing protein [Alphaproteobacteria bacterium]|nr:TonB-dependent receptor plug domain-containing protein [Alphaproteobacteria bacterium]
MLKSKSGRLRALANSVSLFSLPALVLTATPALAQSSVTSDELVVTATRRAVSVQDVPLNIAAIGGDDIEQQDLGDLTELSAYVPGIHIVDQGGHAAHPIIVRGLNADPIGSNDGSNDGGGTVATYVGEVPLFVDLRLQDMERVEVLLGPQGTLYGAGTLGGAIRYLPRKPEFDAATLAYRAEVYNYSEGDDLSNDIGLTANLPITDTFAVRVVLDRLEDQGFIDYNYIVQQPGVSDPDAFATPGERAANLAPVPDANDRDVISGRVAARWAVTPTFDATLTYYFQDSEVFGRQISSHRGTIPNVQEYESTKRVRETFERTNELLALEAEWDVGFAALTSATGYSRYSDNSQRDQTDLLLMLNPLASSYYYDNFPSFTARTRDISDENTFTQELRAVSTHGGPFSWIVGAFYSEHEETGISQEFTPLFSEFLVANYGAVLRTDGLEYYNLVTQDLKESAIYGELGYNITDNWNVTVGGRYYEYDLSGTTVVDLPLLNTAYFGQPDGFIDLSNPTPSGQSDEGFLWKFNTSYSFTDDILAYFTRSEGYRIGDSNGLELCAVPGGGPGQSVCASNQQEFEYTADTTVNYEIGLRTQWLDRRLTLNGAIYLVEWDGPQVGSATLVGSQPITINGTGAESRGFEMNFNADITDHLSVRGSYSYNTTELTSVSPSLITQLNLTTLLPERIDGQEGDRLPGSPENQGSLYINYEVPMGAMTWDFSYGFSAITDVFSRTGARGGGLTLPGYSIHNASITLTGANWNAQLYVKNLFDEFAETGVVSTSRNNLNLGPDDAGGPVFVRSYFTDVAPPRQIGFRVGYEFGS